MFNKAYVLIIFVCSCLYSKAQPYFRRYDSVPVKTNANTLSNPWAGGLNFIQASNIDLNQDGIKDLFIFDRTGNKVRTFVHSANPNTTEFTYAPQYELRFPNLQSWALLVDYNCDDKEDIFTYSSVGGGFDVYKNVSTLLGGIQFEKIVTQQKSVYNPGSPPPFGNPYNLYISSVDIPSFVDIDNDGDIDVLTFAITGTYLEYHQNQSKELNYNCDSLIFEMKNRCWGFAAESPLSNVFTLNEPCPNNVSNPGIVSNDNSFETRSADRHSGNCELCMDLNGDGAKELMIGSITFNNITKLNNGGIPTSNLIDAIDVAFPENNQNSSAVDLAIFPCAFSVDVNNDGVRDLLVSPNAANVSENFNSVLYYKNVGTNTTPAFEFQQYNFLQDNMIDVGEAAYPVLFDYDNDGLLDLFIGNNGYFNNAGYQHKIAQFKNTGTSTQPKFELVTRDYLNLSALTTLVNMIPTFGDMDGDGDADMFIGGDNGQIHYFRNIAPLGSSANFVLSQPNYTNSQNVIIDVGDFAAPQIYDVDNDGMNDLIIGGRNGKLSYYRHIGSAVDVNPVLELQTNFFGNVSVNQPLYVTGYSVPQMFKQGTTTKLLVGTESGYLSMYTNIDGNLSGSFTKADTMYASIYQGSRIAPAIADINNDGFKDLIIGNYQGGVSYYKGVANAVNIEEMIANPIFNFDLFPNPADNSLTIRLYVSSEINFTIDIYNLLGEKLVSQKVSGAATIINTSTLANGMYLCRVSEESNLSKDKNTIATKLFVIHH